MQKPVNSGAYPDTTVLTDYFLMQTPTHSKKCFLSNNFPSNSVDRKLDQKTDRKTTA